MSSHISRLLAITGRTVRWRNYAAAGRSFPEKLKNKKIKNPVHFYLADDAGSKLIFDEISGHLKAMKRKPKFFYEINPGTLSLTELLLNEELFEKLILIENTEDFIPRANVMV